MAKRTIFFITGLKDAQAEADFRRHIAEELARDVTIIAVPEGAKFNALVIEEAEAWQGAEGE